MTAPGSPLRSRGWTASIAQREFEKLCDHLFQPDGEEHAAFILAGTARTAFGSRLLVREVLPVPAAEFTVGSDGYRLSPLAIVRGARRAREQGLALIWAHSHPGAYDEVAFSAQDHRTIREGHPSMVDMTGASVSALVMGHHSVGGEIWDPGFDPAPLTRLRVLGPRIVDIRDRTGTPGSSPDERFARQVLLFGEAGQARLRSLRVAVLGAGGGGSLIIEQLAHLGVGEIWAVDFDRVSMSNLSRIVGSGRLDALLRRRKVEIARRMVRRIDRRVGFRAIVADAARADVAIELAGVDAVFVATDTALSRHAANAIAFQYLVPVFQVGAKVQADEDGRVSTVHTAARIAMPGRPCLHCQGAIPVDQLRHEQLGEVERRTQNYLGGGEDVPDPSVISLNAIPVGVAVTDFLFMFTGLTRDVADLGARIWHPLERRAARRAAIPEPSCAWCGHLGPVSSFARGDTWPLPLPRAVIPRKRPRA